jgi:hypothetical protein
LGLLCALAWERAFPRALFAPWAFLAVATDLPRGFPTFLSAVFGEGFAFGRGWAFGSDLAFIDVLRADGFLDAIFPHLFTTIIL